MRQQWQPALELEGRCAQILNEMTDYGWLLDEDKVHVLQHKIEKVTNMVDAVVMPRIPQLVKKKGAKCKDDSDLDFAIKLPFKKDGSYSANTLKYFPELGDAMCWKEPTFCVDGPFCRFDWVDINLGSNDQVKTYLLSVGWIPTEWNKVQAGERKGERTSPKLTEDSFDSLRDDTGKLVAKRLKYQHRNSTLNGWLRDVRPDGRIGQVISGVTPTFRYTHKKIVNVPGGHALFGKQMRSCFKAKPGYKIVGVDAASCQLRMLCHYMHDDDYTFYVIHGKEEDGTDPHTMNMKKSNGIITDRDMAKRFIYGFLFGAGNEKIGNTVGGTVNTGKKLRQAFLANLPGLASLLKQLTKVWKKRGYIKGLDGRKIYVRSEHMLLVYLLQAAEALLMKVAMVFLHAWFNEEGLDAHYVAFVHDELQAEVKNEDVARYEELAAAAMVRAGEYLKLSVPTAGTPKHGSTWKHTH